MSVYATTFIFDIPGHGFSEEHFIDFQSDNILDQFTIAAELGRRRMLFAGAQCILQGVRISNADVEGRVGTTQYIGIPGVTGKGCAASNVALNCLRATTNNVYTAQTQFRGFWDELEVTGGAVDRTNVDFANAFNSWAQYYVQQGFGWRGQTGPGQKFNVVNYVVSDTGVVRLTLGESIAGLGSAGTRKYVRFSQINGGKSQLNGEQVVRIVDGFTVEMTSQMAVLPFILAGVMRVPTFTLRRAANVAIQRIGKRQAGAPLLRSRGRSPKRIRI